MDVKGCDRCGEFYMFDPDIIFDYNITKTTMRFEGRRDKVLDLCNKCAKELNAFMHPEKLTSSVKHIR